jgi:hypothetical protein
MYTYMYVRHMNTFAICIYSHYKRGKVQVESGEILTCVYVLVRIL